MNVHLHYNPVKPRLESLQTAAHDKYFLKNAHLQDFSVQVHISTLTNIRCKLSRPDVALCIPIKSNHYCIQNLLYLSWSISLSEIKRNAPALWLQEWWYIFLSTDGILQIAFVFASLPGNPLVLCGEDLCLHYKQVWD